MKRKIFLILLFVMIFLTGSFALKAQEKKSYMGKWNFETPSAPEGYTSGVITFKKDSSSMQFTGGYYIYPSSWLKAKGDSITYESNIDGTIVLFSLKIKDKSNVAGSAVWYEGETVMILTKKED